MRTGVLSTLLASCLSVAFATSANATTVVHGAPTPAVDGGSDLVPTGKGWGERAFPGPAPGQQGNAGHGQGSPFGANGIAYHGGPLILGTTQVFYIFYGNWSGNSATTILPDFISHIGGSPYFNINTTYYNGSGTPVSNAVNYPHVAATDNYSHGTALSDSDIQAIVSDATKPTALPLDANAVYFVLTSADVNETSGFCTQYCGWHTHGTIHGMDIKYAFIGNPDRCPSACEWQNPGPNGSGGADGMASIIAHELEEAVTDPDLNAWYDRRGYENADKCAWTFGTTYTSNGALANMRLGSRDYLIQRNWVNASGGYCAVQYP